MDVDEESDQNWIRQHEAFAHICDSTKILRAGPYSTLTVWDVVGAS